MSTLKVSYFVSSTYFNVIVANEKVRYHKIATSGSLMFSFSRVTKSPRREIKIYFRTN